MKQQCCVFSGSLEDSDDQAKLIVGVVAGLLIAAAVVGLIYWLYMKNSRYRNSQFKHTPECTFAFFRSFFTEPLRGKSGSVSCTANLE